MLISAIIKASRMVFMSLSEIVLFFCLLKRQRCQRMWWHVAICGVFLACLYVPLQLKTINPALDFVLRIGVGYLVVRYLYGLPRRSSVFFCMLFFLIVGVSKSLVSRPILLGFGFDLAAYTANSEGRQWIISLLTVALEAAVTWTVSRLMLVEKDEDIPFVQLLIALSSCVTYIITRQVLRSYSAVNEALGGWEITVAMMALCVVTLMISVFCAYFFISDRRSRDIQKLEKLLDVQYANFENQQEADAAVRQMHHDIKNHLNCIRAIASDAQVEDYIDEIYQEINAHEQYFKTGNHILDIILHEKTLSARRKQVQLQVYTSFQTLDFMEYIDICAIFSNALDNAIEAACLVEPPEDRIIQIKIQDTAGCVAVKIINPYAAAPQEVNGRLVTSKENKELHGLGLASIRHSLEKYEGSCEVQHKDGVFTLTILIPHFGEDAK